MIAALCEHYSWDPHFYRRMGWREMQAWVRETNERIRRARGQGQTDTDSWAGRESDGWWDAQNDKARGR